MFLRLENEGAVLPQEGSGRYPKGGAGKAGCPLHPRPRVVGRKHAR